MKIKVGDNVKIIAGKDKGKTGKVMQVFTQTDKLVVEGVNLMIKHQKARKQGEKGQRIQFPAPLHVSNALTVCPKCDKPGRVAYRLDRDEATGKTTKTRICRACKEAI